MDDNGPKRGTVIVVDDGGSRCSLGIAARIAEEVGNPVVVVLEDPEKQRPSINLPLLVLPSGDDVGPLLRRQEQRDGFKKFLDRRGRRGRRCSRKVR